MNRDYCPHCGDVIDLTRNYRNETIIPLHGEDEDEQFTKCEGSYEVIK